MFKFTNFVQNYNSLSLDEFLKYFPKPLLLIEKEKRQAGPKQNTYNTLAGDNQQEVMAILNRIKTGKRYREKPSHLSVVFDFNQVKQSYIISIGRTENNSIVLKDDSMSKFHAYFQNPNEEEWFIVDAGSKNGSFLNGYPLEARSPKALQSNDSIGFSKVYICTFYMPQNFYEYMINVA